MEKKTNIEDKINKKVLPKFKEQMPIPPEYKEVKKEYLEKKIEETGYVKPNIFLKYYLVPVLVVVFNILGFATLFFFREGLGYLFIIVLTFYMGLALPLMLGVGAYSVIRLYLDKNKITNKIKTVLPVSFIVANFFMTQKKILKRICLINADGISFNIGKSRYIIDSEKIFFDNERFANGFWLPNLPNQLGFDFFKEIDRVSEVMRNPEFEIKDLINTEGEMVDIIYSSRNLETFRKDKVFREFHQQTTPESMKLVYMMAGIIITIIIVFLIIVILVKK